MILIVNISCIDQIPINIGESSNEYLIVDATLRDKDDIHSVKIKLNSVQGTDFQADFPVNDAEVSVIENGTTRYVFALQENGNYTNSQLKLLTGFSYELEIKYRDASYKSTQEILYEAVPIGEVSVLLTTEDTNNGAGNISTSRFINLFVASDLPENEVVYLKYGAEGVYEYNERGATFNLNALICYVDEIIDLDNISLVDGESLNNGDLRNKLILQKPVDYRFSQNYCMKVSQQRISKNAYNFWKLVESEYSRTGDIFEKPPGILRGNIQEQQETDVSIIGLFSIAAVTFEDLHITPSMAGSPRQECNRNSTRTSTCYNCLAIPKSTLSRPECF